MMGIDNAEYWALRRWLAYTALQGGGGNSTNLASSYFSAYELSRMMPIFTFSPVVFYHHEDKHCQPSCWVRA